MAIAVLTGVVAFLAAASTGAEEMPPVWVSVVKIVLGAGLLLLSVKNWRDRPGEGQEPPAPKWMAALDGFTPVKSAGLSVVLADVNPKNLLLVVSGGAAIASGAAGSTSAKVTATIVFAVVASLGVAAPVVIYLAMGDRAGAILQNLRTWLVHNNTIDHGGPAPGPRRQAGRRRDLGFLISLRTSSAARRWGTRTPRRTRSSSATRCSRTGTSRG